MVMISLSDNDAWRRLRLTPLLSSSRFPAFSASKCLQNSSIIQNNYLVHGKTVYLPSHFVLKTIIQAIQFPIIILKLFRIIVTKESDFIKAYTIRVFLILLYYRIISFLILYIVM